MATRLADARSMRNIALNGLVVIFGALLAIAYVAVTVAARTALAIAPTH